MKIGLCMTVKNEQRLIKRCLSSIIDLFDSVTIVDTGSGDDTVNILKQEFGITPLPWPPANAPLRKGEYWQPGARNYYLEQSPSEWVLVLDADEIISRQEVLRINAMTPQAEGYFVRWQNSRNNKRFDDYKLVLFRREGKRYEGAVHPNLQADFRRKKLRAEWLEGVELLHQQEEGRPYREQRLKWLVDLSAAHPANNRYKWFLGYGYFQQRDFNASANVLSTVIPAEDELYPVECINSRVVLAAGYASMKNRVDAMEALNMAEIYHARFAEDFEVKVNHWMVPWFKEARQLLESEKFEDIKPPEFAN